MKRLSVAGRRQRFIVKYCTISIRIVDNSQNEFVRAESEGCSRVQPNRVRFLRVPGGWLALTVGEHTVYVNCHLPRKITTLKIYAERVYVLRLCSNQFWFARIRS